MIKIEKFIKCEKCFLEMKKKITENLICNSN